jgi:accessory colonization factor AcfC
VIVKVVDMIVVDGIVVANTADVAVAEDERSSNVVVETS